MRFDANPDQAEHWNSVVGEKWATFQKEVDARLAPATDLLCARASIPRGAAVVDVGCGTGALTLGLADAVGQGGSVLAVDFSEPMLAVAKRRVRAHGLAQVDFLQADAQTHPFEPAGAI